MSTSIGLLAQELAQQNPWWRDPSWARSDPDLVDVRRSHLVYRSGILADLEPGGLFILRGPRRVGKTVAVKQAIEDLLDQGVPPTAIVRVAADGWAAKDLRTLTQRTPIPSPPDGTQRYWFIDEISAVTGAWDQQVKWLRDNDPAFHQATVVLTGSNATALAEAAGALAGRRGIGARLNRSLLPMGFRTFAATILRGDVPPTEHLAPADLASATAKDAYDACLPWINQLVGAWDLYLLYGGFPVSVAAATSGQGVPDRFVEDLFGVIFNDAFRTSRLSPVTEMALLERLWAGLASPANLARVAQTIGASTDAVVRHVEYLRDAHLLWSCPQRAADSWLPRPRTQEKLYAIDPLIARLVHLRNPARSDIDPTVLSEMQLGLAVRRRVIADRPQADHDAFLFYERTPARKEIDFVSEELGGAAIESKYTETGRWRSEAATVNTSPWHGILATRNVLDTSDDDSAWAVPTAFLAWLLDT
ncbi:MAG: AAA family ATPase [Micrococcales bacterium]|nr:AAA family ATPase [Micrococcales bacterium]